MPAPLEKLEVGMDAELDARELLKRILQLKEHL